MTDPSPRTALITGAGQGIGRAVAVALTERGLSCCLVGRTESGLVETARLVQDQPGRALVVPGDITDASARERVLAECTDQLGGIDVLVNNAGLTLQAPLFTYPVDAWRQVLDLNLVAAGLLAQGVIPSMRRQQWGRIVNISSVYGFLGLNDHYYRGLWPTDDPAGPYRDPAYAAAKGGLRALTRELAAAAGPYGITVNTVSPGMIQTEAKRVDPERERAFCEMTPVRRLGTPADVAEAVAFLSSAGAGFITGAEVVVDGGWSIW